MFGKKNVVPLHVIKMCTTMEKDWDFYYEESLGFYKTAANSFAGEGKKFNNELLFNLISMGMEYMLVSLLLYHKKMPLSETVSGMIRELKGIVSWPEEFMSEVRYLNRFVYLCSLDQTPMRIPDDVEIVKVMKIAEEVKERVAAEFLKPVETLVSNNKTK